MKWLVLSAVLGVAGFACYLWLTSESGGINRMSVLRIQPGMSHEDVDAVIGLPYGDHCSTPHNSTFLLGTRILAMHNGQGEARYWYGDTGTITVYFDGDGRVTKRHFSSSTRSFFDSVYRWIGIDAK
jgi:hypothetical protein